MTFTSLSYLALVSVVWLLYIALPRRPQNILLLAASYAFYSAWDWRFLSLILISTAIDFCVGRVLAHSTQQRTRRLALTVSVVANLGLLGFFKYFNFFVDSAAALLVSFGLEPHTPVLRVILPVGISFYTFQTLSYTIDVYRGKLSPTRDFFDFALFVAYFPQLVAGPIERATHLLPLIQSKRTVTKDQIARGLFLISLGLMKKLAIADGLAPSVNAVFNSTETPSGLEVALATYAFAFQILCDFSGYTDIARGTSKLFGIDLIINFNAPYFARSPSEFWKRWHISLSTWLRDYLYIPLGGNRGSRLQTYRNLMLTMTLGGLWHGAAWNFVIWGVYQGALLCGYRATGLEARASIERTAKPTIRALLGRIVVTFLFFQLVCYGWMLFRAVSFDQIVLFTRSLASLSTSTEIAIPRPPLSSLLGLAFLLPWELATYIYGRSSFSCSWHPVLRGVIAGVVFVLLLMGLSNGSSEFIYFQF